MSSSNKTGSSFVSMDWTSSLSTDWQASIRPLMALNTLAGPSLLRSKSISRQKSASVLVEIGVLRSADIGWLSIAKTLTVGQCPHNKMVQSCLQGSPTWQRMRRHRSKWLLKPAKSCGAGPPRKSPRAWPDLRSRKRRITNLLQSVLLVNATQIEMRC